MMNSVPAIGFAAVIDLAALHAGQPRRPRRRNSSVATWNFRAARPRPGWKKGTHLGWPSKARRVKLVFLGRRPRGRNVRAWVTRTAPWRNAVPTQSEAVVNHRPPPRPACRLPRIGSDGHADDWMFSRPTRLFCLQRDRASRHAHPSGPGPACPMDAGSPSRRNKARLRIRRGSSATVLVDADIDVAEEGHAFALHTARHGRSM